MDVTNLTGNSVKNTILFIILVLMQVLVCNNILLFGVAVPMVFIYFIIFLPLGTNLNLFITLAFLLGFLVDLFSDTLGLNSLACIILAVVRRPVFYAYMPREDKNLDISPSILSMGWENYIKFILTLSAIFCFMIFAIEFISFTAFWRMILMTFTSALLTSLLLIGIDSIVNTHSRHW